MDDCCVEDVDDCCVVGGGDGRWNFPYDLAMVIEEGGLGERVAGELRSEPESWSRSDSMVVAPACSYCTGRESADCVGTRYFDLVAESSDSFKEKERKIKGASLDQKKARHGPNGTWGGWRT